MASYELTQAEADGLRLLDKRRVDEAEWIYPSMGGGISIPLMAVNGREQFILDIRRGRINLAKGSYQNRGRRTIVLVRLCFGGAPHENPDGKPIGSPHIHLYREGYGDKWAYNLQDYAFTNVSDRWGVFQDFSRFCNIVEPPNIKLGLSV